MPNGLPLFDCCRSLNILDLNDQGQSVDEPIAEKAKAILLDRTGFKFLPDEMMQCNVYVFFNGIGSIGIGNILKRFSHLFSLHSF